MDLFSEAQERARRRVAPLAVRMRPRTLDEFVGQEHLLAPGHLLRRAIESDTLQGAIFHGPPGTGKTTLARLIAAHSQAAFETLHAAEAGVRDVRRVIDGALARLERSDQRTVLFLDEIHRFSRAQQDVLLREVEEGVLRLVGATTENPYFAVNSPLISRSQVFEFRALEPRPLRRLLERALRDRERGLGALEVEVREDALEFIALHANGDARRALAALEAAVLSERGVGERARVDREVAAACLQRRPMPHDATGDTHYDLASALIKSMRGCDPDATVYWLARLLEAGEDPRFLARRICICASEDVGTADSEALLVAAAAAQVVELVGMPECRYALAHAAIRVACAPRSDAVTRAIEGALSDVRSRELLPVPAHLRDPRSAHAARGDTGYRSPHDSPEAAAAEDYLGARRSYYNPGAYGEEAAFAAGPGGRRGAPTAVEEKRKA